MNVKIAWLLLIFILFFIFGGWEDKDKNIWVVPLLGSYLDETDAKKEKKK